MAKVLLGPIVSEARNKQGNLVYSRNTYGSYIRAWKAPTEVASTQRTAVWVAYGNATKRWSSTLTEAHRRAWRAFASTHPITDKFGNKQHLSGHGYYCRINAPKFRYTAAYIDSCPTSTLTLPIQSLTLDLNRTASHFWVGWTPTPNVAPYWLIIAMSPAKNAGVNYFGSNWCFIAQYGAAQASPVDVYAAYVTRYGAPAVAKKIAARVTRLHNTNGHISAALITSATTY